MDPWLEDPVFWPGVHHGLITDLAREISSKTAPRYVAMYGIRVIVEAAQERPIGPDVVVYRHTRKPMTGTRGATIDPAVSIEVEPLEVEQAYIEIRLGGATGRLVTVIEVLSPTNKAPGSDGHEKYVQKQREILSSDVHLVEIDLLRGGEHTVSVPSRRLRPYKPYDYFVAIRRAQQRSHAEAYPIKLRDRLPRIPIPLLEGDSDLAVDLQVLIEGVYEAGTYWAALDYRQSPVPPLPAEDAVWAKALTRARSK